MRICLPLLSFIIVVGCVETEEASLFGQLTEAEALACEADGGDIGFGGSVGEVCIRPSPDAGKSCTRSSQCTSYCDAETRTCAATDYSYGCYSYLDESGSALSICVN